MKRDSGLSRTLGVVVASGLGILIGLIDRAALFGDDSSKPTILLWLASSGFLGFAMPDRAWRWAVFVGPWLPAMYLVFRFFGSPNPIHPDTYASSLLLVPFSLVICLIGAYSGAAARRAIRPPSRPLEAFPGAGA